MDRLIASILLLLALVVGSVRTAYPMMTYKPRILN